MSLDLGVSQNGGPSENTRVVQRLQDDYMYIYIYILPYVCNIT